MTDYCPGAVQVPQPGGGGLDASLPPRAIWHITWDALRADGTQPNFSAVAGYLQRQEYCPHIMWNPFTGYMEQYYPASQSARALVAWNQDGAVNVQIETFFTPGCVVDGVKYNTVADTPCRGLGTILDWLDSLGIPRVWPMGAPQWQGNSRDAAIWNSSGGHYGHCNVPDNTHTDPGPMPDITGSISPMGTIQENTVTPEQMATLVAEIRAIGTVDQQIADATRSFEKGLISSLSGQLVISPQQAEDIVSAVTSRVPNAVLNAKFKLADGTLANLAGLLDQIHARPAGSSPAAVDVEALVARLKTELPAAIRADIAARLTQP
ncbi:hypothetical protein [Pseudarthrobacter sp. S9]|uniref:hypothetical protein n=1 Tax=Pseudarthrobacter sp. S9 TaxID=3418421 RepID=UPI003D02BE0F